jgi:CPA1 family monovalent cation:H+ antiporter
MSWFEIVALLLVSTAGFGWLNRRWFGLPNAVAFVASGLALSGAVALEEWLWPGSGLHDVVGGAVRQIDFSAVVMNGMLAFLLFAGAFDLDLGRLRARAGPVFALAAIGSALSAVLVGGALWWVADWLGAAIPLVWCLLFGALISPTDPVAVISILRGVEVPEKIEIELQGEALFNDGAAVFLVTLLLGALAGGETPRGWDEVVLVGLREVGGGIVIGFATGFVAYRAIHAIDDFRIEVLITLALVSGTYVLAQRLEASGPLAVVTAGLLVGDRGPRFAMSDRSQRIVSGLWRLIDEVLNAVLFLLIGLEVLVLRFADIDLRFVLAAIPIVLVSRLIAVAAPALALPWSRALSLGNVPLLTWAGIRGGVSIALALSLPDAPAKPAVLGATYAVVIFSILVQGLTLGAVARRYAK